MKSELTLLALWWILRNLDKESDNASVAVDHATGLSHLQPETKVSLFSVFMKRKTMQT